MNATLVAQPNATGFYDIQLSSNGDKGGSEFVPNPGNPGETSALSNRWTVGVSSTTVTQSPATLNVSTGDTSDVITVSVSPSIYFTPVFSSALQQNSYLGGSCNASLAFSNTPGTGSANTCSDSESIEL